MVIDEINRGDLSKIFGELIFGLETSYRGKKIQTRLSETLGPLVIPANLLVIGTMNSVDRSIAIVDFALRRRFVFYEIMPDENILKNYLDDPQNTIDPAFAMEIMEFYRILNTLISGDKKLGRHHQIGHVYFFVKDWDDFRETWKYKIFPLLEEYLDMDADKIHAFLDTLEQTCQAMGPEITDTLHKVKEKYQV